MSVTRHPRVQYEDLLTSYHHSLTTKLRGFRSTEEFEFLETWVPDDEDARSILNLIEAAKDAHLIAVSIVLRQDTQQRLPWELLVKEARQFGEVVSRQVGSHCELTVSFAGAPEPLDIHPTYHDRLQAYIRAAQYQQPLSSEEQGIIVQAQDGHVTLSALVDATHTITRLAYQDVKTPVERGLMEALCGLIINTPIFEAADHAAIRLERHLRDQAQPPPVAGIVTPENADPAFAMPRRLIRALFTAYSSRTGFQGKRNMYDAPAAPAWRALSVEEQRARLQIAIDAHPAGRSIEVARLEGPQRVIVRFREVSDNLTKQAQLLTLERHLKTAIEPTLQVYLQPKGDENKPRQAKGVRV